MGNQKKTERSALPWKILVAVVIVAVAASSLYFGFFAGVGPIEVRTAVVARKDIASNMMLSAEIQPGRKQETVVAQQTVDAVLVEIGDRVTKGDLLVTYDLTDLEQAVADAADAVKAAQDAVAATKKAIASAKKSTTSASQTLQTNLTELSVSLTSVLDDLTTQFGLSPTEEQQTTLSKLSDSLSAVFTILGGSSLAFGLDPTLQLQSALTQASAATTQAQQAEKLALRRLDASVPEIRAEFDGIVVDIGSSTGTISGLGSLTGSMGTSVAVRLYDDAVLRGFFRANRYDAARIQEGQPVIYRLDGREYTGKVLRKGRVAKSVTSTSGIEPMIDVEMTIEGVKPGELTIGFTLDAEITTARRTGVLTIPAEAMKKDKDGYYVYTVVDGKAVRRAVEPGIQSDADAEILSGLTEEDRVVLNPPNALAEGGRVKEKA